VREYDCKVDNSIQSTSDYCPEGNILSEHKSDPHQHLHAMSEKPQCQNPQEDKIALKPFGECLTAVQGSEALA